MRLLWVYSSHISATEASAVTSNKAIDDGVTSDISILEVKRHLQSFNSTIPLGVTEYLTDFTKATLLF